LIRRGLYYSHREMNVVMDEYLKGENFYLFTGRGPSSESMHLGHLIPFILTKYFQDVFDAPCVIQIADDEKLFWKKNYTMSMLRQMGIENIKDIIAIGFKPEKTFIFSDFEYMGYLYPACCKIANNVQSNVVRKLFGFEPNAPINVGKYIYPVVQAAPSFAMCFKPQFQSRKMRCLVPCAIDQDPYFRMCRDAAKPCAQKKPTTIYAKMVPGLSGPKMSASNANTVIFLNDDMKSVKKKLMAAVSGGQDTVEEQRAKGAQNLEKDTAYQYLRFFMDDDKKLEQIRKDYTSGKMLSGDVKKELCNVLIPMLEAFQKRRSQITDEDVREFMQKTPDGEFAFRPFKFRKNPNLKPLDTSKMLDGLKDPLPEGVMVDHLKVLVEAKVPFHVLKHEEFGDKDKDAEDKFKAQLPGIFCKFKLMKDRCKPPSMFLLVAHNDTVVREGELQVSLPFIPTKRPGPQKLDNAVMVAKKEVKKIFGKKTNVEQASPLSLATVDPKREIKPVLDVSLRASEVLCLRVGNDKTHTVIIKTKDFLGHLEKIGYNVVNMDFE